MQLRLSVAMVQCLAPVQFSLALCMLTRAHFASYISCVVERESLRCSAGLIMSGPSTLSRQAEQNLQAMSHILSCTNYSQQLHNKLCWQDCVIPGSARSQLCAAGRPSSSTLTPYAYEMAEPHMGFPRAAPTLPA